MSILIGIRAVEVVEANPVPWPTTPILDNPTITIHSPSNNTEYTNGNTTISLTVTKPDSWKRELFPYALVDSVGTYLDGKSILLYTTILILIPPRILGLRTKDTFMHLI